MLSTVSMSAFAGESGAAEGPGGAGESGTAGGPGGAGESGSAEGSGGAGGQGGGTGAAGQEFGTYDEVKSAAGVIIEDGTVIISDDFNGSITGDITENKMSDAKIEADEANAVAITLANETDTYLIENSDISASAGLLNNDLGYEAAYGVGIAVKTGELWIKNSTISSEGARSTPIYMFSTSQPEGTSLVAIDSVISTYTDKPDIWMPPFKLLAGGSRATLLMTRNNSWFIHCNLVSNNWGAFSQDSVDAMTYAINSTGTATEGGYGIYLTYGLKLYASQLYGGQYGAFMCGNSLLETGTAEAAMADEDAMSKTPDYEVIDEETIIAAPFNAVVVHNSLPDNSMLAVGNFKDAVLSTLLEDLPDTVTPMAADDEFFMNPDAPFGVGSGAAYFYNKNLYGSLILVRSMNADFTFDNTKAYSSNGVLVQTVVTFDPPSASGYLSAGQGEGLPGVSITFKNGEYTGDILHQDYQRKMLVTIDENASLNAAIMSGTYQGWNNLWEKQNLEQILKEDGYDTLPFESESWDQDVMENLTIADDTAYAETENYGVDLILSENSVWTVTGDSSLSSLTIEEGAIVKALDGYKLTVYENADASNSNASYTGGTEIQNLEAASYQNVILILTEE